MSDQSPIEVAIRSYGADQGAHRHDFHQLVLPLSGALSIDIAGRGGRVDPSRAAFVDRGASHATVGETPNRSIIVDLDVERLAPGAGERLVSRPFVQLTPMAVRLIDYMGLLLAAGEAPAASLRLWAPLLLEALTYEAPRARLRLAPLLALVEADPARPWTTAAMAAQAGVSVSRLHDLFRAELETTPHAWLAEVRLRRVREGLAGSDLAIAELAYRSGYADQSALTRAMRKAIGMTPAAYRRRSREARAQEPGTRIP